MPTTSILRLCAAFVCLCSLLGAAGDSSTLKYHDDKPDGKKSLGGSGEMISFSLPAEGARIGGIRIHGSRYGTAQPPKEDFLIYFLDQKLSEIIRTELAAYSLFERGPEKWVEVKFRQPVELPKDFWVALDFRATGTKGVYVSFDTSSGGKSSKVGLPGIKARESDTGGDWMIELLVAP